MHISSINPEVFMNEHHLKTKIQQACTRIHTCTYVHELRERGDAANLLI